MAVAITSGEHKTRGNPKGEAAMKTKTNLNETILRDGAKGRGLKVRTSLKAGRRKLNA